MPDIDTAAAEDARILRSASSDSNEWNDTEWDAWFRTAERVHGDGQDRMPLFNRVGALMTRVAKLETAQASIRYLHLDSVAGPCPVCFDGDGHAAGGDGLVPYPCPTARLAGATDIVPTGRPLYPGAGPDPLTYGPSGYRCGCGKAAHSNLTPCRDNDPDRHPSHPAPCRIPDSPDCVCPAPEGREPKATPNA